MKKTHWKKYGENPDYLGSWDFDEGEERVFTIGSVRTESVSGTDGKKEDCRVMRFKEPGVKPMVVNATNAKVIQKLYKTPYVEDWIGKRVAVHVEPIRAFGEVWDALRIVNRIPSAPRASGSAPVCSDCGAGILGFDPSRPPEWVAKYTSEKYGRPLCRACAEKAKLSADPLAESAGEKNDTAVPDPLAGEVELL